MAGIADDLGLGRRAAAEIEDHFGGKLEARHHELRIDAALETVAGVGDDAQRAAGAGDVQRLPQGRFDQHVGGGGVAAGMLAAHDAGNRFDAVVVCYDAHLRRQRVFAPVERQHLLAFAGAPHDEVALDLGRVEDMQRPAAVEGDVVGDVDQRVDRPQPDGDQPLLQPFRRRPVVDAAHQAQREAAAQRRRVGEVERHLHRRLAMSLDGHDRRRLQRSQARGREVAGDAVDAGRIGPVRRQIDLDHRIVEMGVGGKAGADRRVLGQVDDAVMLVGKLQLALRAHHAAAFDAADVADAELDVDAGNIAARRGKGADQPGPRIGRAAHHLHRRAAVAGIDGQHLQLVGVRMPLCGEHAGDDEGFQARLVVDRFDLEADRRQPLDDLGKRGIGLEMVFQPGKGEFHRGAPSGLGTLVPEGSTAPGTFWPRKMLAIEISSSISGQ